VWCSIPSGLAALGWDGRFAAFAGFGMDWLVWRFLGWRSLDMVFDTLWAGSDGASRRLYEGTRAVLTVDIWTPSEYPIRPSKTESEKFFVFSV
jgi:hypothetical protein